MTVPTIVVPRAGRGRQRPPRSAGSSCSPQTPYGRCRRRARRARAHWLAAVLGARGARRPSTAPASAFFIPAFDAVVPDLAPVRRSGRRELTRPVRAADRTAPRRTGAGRVARGHGNGRRVRGDAASFARFGRRCADDAPARRLRGARRPSRRFVPSSQGCASSAGASGSGERSSPPRLPISSSSALPRCCCPTSSRTTSTLRRGMLGLVFAAGGLGPSAPRS